MPSTDEHDERQQRHQVADIVMYWMRRRDLPLIGSAARSAAHRQCSSTSGPCLADFMRLPKKRRASHLLDVARGYAQKTHQLITDLIRSYPRGSSAPVALTKVARAVGVTV